MDKFSWKPFRWLVIAASVTFASCSSEPPTRQNAKKELNRVLQVWKSGEFYLSPGTRMSQYKKGRDVRRFFENRLDTMSLKSFEIVSQDSTGKDGEFKFKVRLTVKSNAMSVMNPARQPPEDIDGTYYVYQGKEKKWIVESESMRAAMQSLAP